MSCARLRPLPAHDRKADVIARVADYLIITDGKSQLQLTGPGGAKVWTFAVPDNVHFNSRSVLTFFLERMRNADKMQWAVYINNKEVFTFKFSGSRLFANSIHEVIPSKLFKLSTQKNKKPNTIMFMRKSGAGMVEFSDVVLWVQADV